MEAERLFLSHVDGPVGKVALLADPRGALVRIAFLHATSLDSFASACRGDGLRVVKDEHPTAEARRQLREYFERKREAFDLLLRPKGTPFQIEVWKVLRRIPYGRTWSYGDVARTLGDPGAARAVGRANNANPLPIVVPCHRVIGADGSLVGFGGGLDAKRRLLELERGEHVEQGRLF